MRPDLPSRLAPKFISASSTLTAHDVISAGLFVATGSGISITLPAPGQAVNAAECIVVNNSAGNVTITCSGGFPNSANTVTLVAGASVCLYCAQVSGSVYRWSVVGATPA